jgi:hypothetical protein
MTLNTGRKRLLWVVADLSPAVACVVKGLDVAEGVGCGCGFRCGCGFCMWGAYDLRHRREETIMGRGQACHQL